MCVNVTDGSTHQSSVEQELLALADRLSDFREQGSRASAQELVAELETALEELRVTSEEIAAQQRHIAELLQDNARARATADRLVAGIPTPVMTTDADGTLVDVNTAGGRLFGVPLDRLKGKPLAAYIGFEDRRAVRTMLSDVIDGRSPSPASVSVTPRGDSRYQVLLVAVPAYDSEQGAPRVRWFADVTSQNHGGSLALLGSFAELLAIPSTADGVTELVPRIVAIAQRAIPEAANVTVTVGDPRRPEQIRSNSTQAQAADAAQLEAGEGPCVDAFLTDRLVSSDAVAEDPRWPELARRLRATETGSVIGVPIRDESGIFGVLNLYGPANGPLCNPAVRERAGLFARAASSLVQDSRRMHLLREESRNLRQALVSRPEIDQAKGILMGRFGYSADDAFQHLVAVSQKRNVKLRDIARDVVSMVQKAADRQGPG